MTGLKSLTPDTLEKLCPILLDQPPGKVKRICPQKNGSQELKGQNDLGEKCLDTLWGEHPLGIGVVPQAMEPERESEESSLTEEVEHSTILKNDMLWNVMDGTQVDQGKSGMAHPLRGLATMTQDEWVMAGQEQAW